MESKNQNLLIKYACRSRPESLFKIITSVFNHAKDHEHIRLLISIDKDDTMIYNKVTLLRLKYLLKRFPISLYFGDHTDKVDSINRDIDRVKDWDLLLHITDFTPITRDRFDTIIKRSCSKRRVTLLPSANHINNKHHYIPVVGRHFYDHYTYVYNPLLNANFCLDELSLRASKDDALKVIDHPPVHLYLHPRFGYGAPDDLLISNSWSWREDLHIIENSRQ